MASLPVRRFASLAALLVLVATLFPSQAATGDLWEVTSRMSMEGVPMQLPGQKVKVCSPKVWTEPPGGADERRKCASSDFKVEGTKATWKVTCAGPPAMAGHGELTREGDDAWSGAIKFASEEGVMNVTLGGRRLGDCEVPQ
jgi:hypothetical protein